MNKKRYPEELAKFDHMTEDTVVSYYTCPHCSTDMKTNLGEGTIEKVEPLCIEGAGITISSYPSRIVLDSGEVTEGLNCWWRPVTEKEDEWAKEKADPMQDIKDVIEAGY